MKNQLIKVLNEVEKVYPKTQRPQIIINIINIQQPKTEEPIKKPKQIKEKDELDEIYGDIHSKSAWEITKKAEELQRRDPFIRYTEASRRFRVSYEKIKTLIRTGKVRLEDAGFVSVLDIEKLLSDPKNKMRTKLLKEEGIGELVNEAKEYLQQSGKKLMSRCMPKSRRHEFITRQELCEKLLISENYFYKYIRGRL